MRTNTFRLFGFTLLTGLLVTATAVNADDAVHTAAMEDQPVLVGMTDSRGFVTQLPAVDGGALVEQLHVLRSAEIARKQDLAGELAEKQFDAGDTLVALVMPGGLLYAGYKKAAYARAKSTLDEISETIAAYSEDLAMLQAQPQPVSVAHAE